MVAWALAMNMQEVTTQLGIIEKICELPECNPAKQSTNRDLLYSQFRVGSMWPEFQQRKK